MVQNGMHEAKAAMGSLGPFPLASLPTAKKTPPPLAGDPAAAAGDGFAAKRTQPPNGAWPRLAPAARLNFQYIHIHYMDIHIHIDIHICMYVCIYIHVHMYVCMYVCIYIYIYVKIDR